MKRLRGIKMAEGKCPPHYWIIDDKDVGHCIKPGCGVVRDFGKKLEKWRKKESEGRVERGQRSMRGRPRKAKMKGVLRGE